LYTLSRGRAAVAVTTWREALILGWSGMRGGVSLAAALAIPLAIAGRDLIIVLTFGVILVTLVLQGLSLPILIQRLGVVDPQQTASEERAARLAAHRAVLAYLDSEAAPTDVPPELVARVRGFYEKRISYSTSHSVASLTGTAGAPGDPDPVAAYQQLKRTLLQVQRQTVKMMHDQGQLGDEGRRRVERNLDLEEAQL
jgi:CPA1 family monovalent cation:H+ antiporter